MLESTAKIRRENAPQNFTANIIHQRVTIPPRQTSIYRFAVLKESGLRGVDNSAVTRHTLLTSTDVSFNTNAGWPHSLNREAVAAGADISALSKAAVLACMQKGSSSMESGMEEGGMPWAAAC